MPGLYAAGITAELARPLRERDPEEGDGPGAWGWAGSGKGGTRALGRLAGGPEQRGATRARGWCERWGLAGPDAVWLVSRGNRPCGEGAKRACAG